MNGEGDIDFSAEEGFAFFIHDLLVFTFNGRGDGDRSNFMMWLEGEVRQWEGDAVVIPVVNLI